MNKKKNFLKLDYIILLCISILLLYSIIFIYKENKQNKYLIIKKIIQIIISIITMIVVSNINPVFYKKNANIIYIICNILLIIVLLTSKINKGAKRWINLHFFKFQPSELFKIIIPIMISKIINENSYPIENKKIILSLIIIFIPAIMIVIQPDLGTAILIIISGFITLYFGGIKKKKIFFFLLILPIILPIIWIFFLKNYQKNRILTLFNYNKKNNSTNYHINQSKIAIGSGGLWGKGILNGTQSKFEFIPEQTTDFIFAVIAEETGYIGIIILLLIYIILITKSLFITYKTKNNFNKLLSSSLIAIFSICIFINISMVIGILPIVGIPLPLISYGGSSTLCMTIIFGIIIAIKNHKK